MADIYAPTGTVTFLFTDVVGSTRLWAAFPETMSMAAEQHDDAVRGAIETHGGYVFSTAGDSFAAAISNADNAVAAARSVQRALHEVRWPDGIEITVRAGQPLVGGSRKRGRARFGFGPEP